jgi:hypothetical protein
MVARGRRAAERRERLTSADFADSGKNRFPSARLRLRIFDARIDGGGEAGHRGG